MQNDPEALLELVTSLKDQTPGLQDKIRASVRPTVIKVAEEFAAAPMGFQFNALVYNWSAKEIRDRLANKNYEVN